jgi:hypothetical protein
MTNIYLMKYEYRSTRDSNVPGTDFKILLDFYVDGYDGEHINQYVNDLIAFITKKENEERDKLKEETKNEPK